MKTGNGMIMVGLTTFCSQVLPLVHIYLQSTRLSFLSQLPIMSKSRLLMDLHIGPDLQ